MRNYPIKYIGTDGKKHAKCKTCGRDWLIGRKGGGMVYQAAIRHTTVCPTKHAPDVVESAASSDISTTPEVSVSEADSTPATTQVM